MFYSPQRFTVDKSVFATICAAWQLGPIEIYYMNFVYTYFLNEKWLRTYFVDAWTWNMQWKNSVRTFICRSWFEMKMKRSIGNGQNSKINDKLSKKKQSRPLSFDRSMKRIRMYKIHRRMLNVRPTVWHMHLCQDIRGRLFVITTKRVSTSSH